MEEVIHDLRRVLMDPECDIYQNEEIEEGGDPHQTRPISKDELSQIRDHHRRKSRETGADEAEKGTEGLKRLMKKMDPQTACLKRMRRSLATAREIIAAGIILPAKENFIKRFPPESGTRM